MDAVVTETTATTVTLTWDSGNPDPVSYYVIQYKPRSWDGPFQEVDGVATTRYNIGRLSPFSKYEFHIITVNKIGRGPPSGLLEAQTGEQAPSSPPLKVQAQMLSSSTMLVQWEPPEEPNGLVRGYRVYFTKDPDQPFNTWQKHNVGSRHLTILGSLTTNTTYSMRVLAYTSVGDGSPSDIIKVKTQQGVPAQPTDFQAEAESDTRILLTWLLPPHELITKYELLIREGEDGKQQKITFDPASSYAIEGLKPDTLYRFQLAAWSDMRLGVYTPNIEARTAQSMPGAPPQKVEVDSINATSLRVTWKSPVSNKHHGQIRGYQVAYVRLENNEPRGLQVIKDVMLAEAQMNRNKSNLHVSVRIDAQKVLEEPVDYEAVIGGLTPETTYSVTVAAYTTKGDGAKSKPKVVTTTGADGQQSERNR